MIRSAWLLVDVVQYLVVWGFVQGSETTRSENTMASLIHMTHQDIVLTSAQQWTFLAGHHKFDRHGFSSLGDCKTTSLVGLN